ncbi:MAG: DNA repair protein RecO [Candidatus Izemoplasmatales bacterium]|nr:DNA repair protein RecO [Candidatus Izemoplasmatales bacterium]MDD4354794.1 DNA repair protein RecO [Candidatus Izemoplasmatales bacterium]MDD5601366.1 DNA repair protein RecO [Candidatus Izemoplasmatales bacterium]MDY0373062.1 DNA repair protein RecO [Candidatus Izemoplasmatales bacterium]
MTKFTGFILKRMDYKESSKILFCYTESGKKSVLVRGANRLSSPFLSITEVLTLVEISSQGKNLETVKEIDVIAAYGNIKADLIKYTYCLHLLELLYQVSEAEMDHSKLFHFLTRLLLRIEVESDFIPYCLMFESKLLYLLGIQPEFARCVVCKKTNNLRFVVSEGGMCCPNHLPLQKSYPPELIKKWLTLYLYNLDQPSGWEIKQEELIELRHVLDEYYRYHLSIETTSRKLLSNLLGY